MNNKIKEFIELMECFETENRLYWIGKLKTSDSIKGFLIVHFNLI